MRYEINPVSPDTDCALLRGNRVVQGDERIRTAALDQRAESAPIDPEVVYWEGDPNTTRTVVGYCKTCARMHPTLPLRPARLVSPSGISHHPSDYGDTSCGKDATQGDWWWRS